MKLRFAVNQGESLRRGIDCNSSTVTIEVNPAEISQEDRNLIADRMVPGKIDVWQAWPSPDGDAVPTEITHPPGDLILASSPDYEGLIEAVREDQKKVLKASSQKSNG